MGYIKNVRGGEHDLFRHTHTQVLEATQVFAGKTVLDPLLFGALPQFNTDALTERDGITTAITDFTYSFTSAIYSRIYGRTSSRLHFQHDEPVLQSISRWNNSIDNAFRATVTPAECRRLFFSGGLWHVFIDRFTQPEEEWRDRLLSTSDIKSLERDKRLLSVAKAMQPYLQRNPPAGNLPHGGSHLDARKFSNAVLHIGESDLGLKTDDDKASLLANSLPELRRLALLEILGVNRATGTFLLDKGSEQYARDCLIVDDKRPHVGFNMNKIQDLIEETLPDVATYPHRGCPVVYQTTECHGRQEPIFSVMDSALVRMYQTSGALRYPGLR